MFYAPIVLFVYNRPEHTRQTLEALSANTLASESDLIVFCDGPKENATQEQIEKIRQTREVARSKQWCKSVEIRESEQNKGLAKSIIEGVTEIVNKYGAIIVLEDDIVTGKYFLDYMNTALEKYKDEKKIFHITGWRNPVKHTDDSGTYIYPVMDCWSWATWADRWRYFDKNPLKLKDLFTEKMKYHFNMDGADSDKWNQIETNISGKINTWAIFWGASIFLQKGLCLAPTKSIVKNVGLDNSGVHCCTDSRREIKDSIDRKILNFPLDIKVNKKEYNINKKFVKEGKKTKNYLKEVIKYVLKKLHLYNFAKSLVKNENITIKFY